MKHLVITFFIYLFPVLGYSQPYYTVTVNGSGFPRQKVKLIKYAQGTERLDSAIVEGDFTINLTNAKEVEPMWYVLQFEKSFKVVSLSSDKNVTVTINWQDLNQYHLPGQAFQTKGSPATQSRYNLDRVISSYNDKLIGLKNLKDSLIYVKKSSELVDSQIKSTANDLVNTLLAVVDTTQAVMTACYSFYPLVSINEKYNLNRAKTISEYFNRIQTQFEGSTYLKLTVEGLMPEIKAALETKEVTKLLSGAKLPNFILKDRNGKIYKKLTVNNKITLIDFWASWCGPCRAEMPSSISLANDLSNDVNFVYISIDQKRDQWEKALSLVGLNESKSSFILDDELKAAFLKELHLDLIPRYILLDKEGNIVEAYARRPSDPLLKKQLKSYIH